MPLVVSPCRKLCHWRPARAAHAHVTMLACSGCGSQWLPGEAWTPMDADGTVPAAVTTARAEAAAGSADSETRTGS